VFYSYSKIFSFLEGDGVVSGVDVMRWTIPYQVNSSAQQTFTLACITGCRFCRGVESEMTSLFSRTYKFHQPSYFADLFASDKPSYDQRVLYP